MDFGQSENLAGIDWSLPPDNPQNESLSLPSAELGVFAGCPIWANTKWLGGLYPTGTPRQRFLAIYSQNFPTIEYNGSFYHVPSRQQIDEWKNKVDKDFHFCPKFPKTISHRESFYVQEVEATVEAFRALGSHLGLPFLQFPPTFNLKHGGLLKEIVSQINHRIPLAVELRHSSWLVDRQLHPRVRQYFVANDLKTVILDTPGRRDLLHSTLTSDQVMIRFLASENQETDRRRIHDWCQRIRQWKDLGLRRLYFFTHAPDDIHAPKLADLFIESYNEVCGGDVPRPRLEQQMSLI